jgi:inorganic pyrophosphatase
MNEVSHIFDRDFWQAWDLMVQESELVIDRPKGSRHPRFPAMVYPVDYGYLKDTASMDGGGIDLWCGTKDVRTIDAIICTVDLCKKDSEIKLLMGCTEEEKELIYCFHNNSQFMKGILIGREDYK